MRSMSLLILGFVGNQVHQLMADDFTEVVARNLFGEEDATSQPLFVDDALCQTTQFKRYRRCGMVRQSAAEKNR